MELITAFLLAFTASQGAVSPPKAPPFEPASFDTRRVAQAIGKLLPRGGSAVVVTPTGVALTAYHVMAPCVVRLRRDPATRSFFHEDGSYYGERGALLCAGFTMELPNCADGVDKVERVYVLGVPPVREAIVLSDSPELATLSDEPPVPRSDFTVIKIDHPIRHYLQLVNYDGSKGTPMWVAGYLNLGDREWLTSDDARLHRELDHLLFRTRAALFGILADAATDLGKGVESAQAFLKSYKRPTGSFGDLIAATMGEEIADLEEIAKGPQAAKAIVRKQLLALAQNFQGGAKSEERGEEERASFNRRAELLRQLAESAEGPSVRKVMLSLKAQASEFARNVEWDLAGDYTVPSEQWCDVLALSGRVTSVTETVIRSSAFVGPGMSGGPALDQEGSVIGISIRGQHLLSSYHPDNLILARSDVVVRQFGTLLKAPATPVTQPTAMLGAK